LSRLFEQLESQRAARDYPTGTLTNSEHYQPRKWKTSGLCSFSQNNTAKYFSWNHI